MKSDIEFDDVAEAIAYVRRNEWNAAGHAARLLSAGRLMAETLDAIADPVVDVVKAVGDLADALIDAGLCRDDDEGIDNGRS